MSTQYDPRVLQEYADDLYTQAKWIIFGTALRYFLVALVLSITCAAILLYVQPRLENSGAAVWIIGIFSVIGIAAGVDAGKKKAFELKLKAQQILCQVQIEQNTSQQEKSLAATPS